MPPVTSRTAAKILHVLPRERITRLVGRVAMAHVPKFLLDPVLGVYSRAYAVNLDEAVVPPEGFASFNEFCTRRLREGVHVIDDRPDVIVSPADGRLDDDGPIDRDARFLVKGQTYDVATLLGSAEDAKTYEGGHYAVVYLSPRDYHCVHSPVAGTVRAVRHIPGSLYPVNELGVKHVPLLFARNERVVVSIDTEDFGTVAVVFVGAFVVGQIRLAFDAPPRPPHGGEVAYRAYDPSTAPRVERGSDLGAFLLGSTVVIVLPPAARGHWERAALPRPAPVRVGQAVAHRTEA